MNAHAADARPVLSIGSRVALDGATFTTRPHLLGRFIAGELADLIEQAVIQGADPSTLRIEGLRDGSAPVFVMRVTARQKESQ